jgi:L-iditol 2-dehydrogenase
MKAAVLYGNEDIRYTDYPTPEVKPGYIKVKVHAAGICGSDVPRVLSNGAHFYPIVLGHEFAGEVVELGEGVENFKIGDRVAGVPLVPCGKCEDCNRGNYSLCKHYSFIGSREQGSFADYVVIPAANAVKFSNTVPYEHAAMFEPSTVALHGLFCNDYQGGGDVAVLGCGTIGTFTLQWAKIFGAKRVVAFDIDDERLELAKKLGACEGINTLKEGYMEKAKAITGGRGFDYVFETAGNPITMLMAFEAAANKAHVCFIGTPTRNVEFTPKQMELLNRKEFKLTGSWMSYSAPFPGKEWEITKQCLADGRLKFEDGVIFKKFPLSEADKAFALYKTRGAVKGKIMFIND